MGKRRRPRKGGDAHSGQLTLAGIGLETQLVLAPRQDGAKIYKEPPTAKKRGRPRKVKENSVEKFEQQFINLPISSDGSFLYQQEPEIVLSGQNQGDRETSKESAPSRTRGRPPKLEGNLAEEDEQSAYLTTTVSDKSLHELEPGCVTSTLDQEGAKIYKESTTYKRKERPRKVKGNSVKNIERQSINLLTSDSGNFLYQQEPERLPSAYNHGDREAFEESEASMNGERSLKLEENLGEEFEQAGHITTIICDNSGFHQQEPGCVASTPDQSVLSTNPSSNTPEAQKFALKHLSETPVLSTPDASPPKQNDGCISQASSVNLTDLAAMLDDGSPDLDEVGSLIDHGLVKVGKYRVKEDKVPLLESILSKHGDIAENCVFETSTNRSSLLENVCDLYQKLEKEDPKSIKIVEVKSMLVKVGDLEKVGLNVKWLLDRLNDIAKALDATKGYPLLKEELNRNNDNAEKKRRELEELEEMIRVAQSEVAAIEARGEELSTRISEAKAKWSCFCKQCLVDGLV